MHTNKPKKLIREKIVAKLQPEEVEVITDPQELNSLYALKVKEELEEIQQSGHKDIMEFVDLIHAAYSWANVNGFTNKAILHALTDKIIAKGAFSNLALNNLNPQNPSNHVYFRDL